MFLLHSDKIVVFLAALYEEVLAVDEVVGGDDLVKGCELLLVERYAAALYELAHLALAGENLDIVAGEELYGGLTQLVLGEGEVGHSGEDVEQCGLVELLQVLLGGFTEEDVAGLDSHLQVFL